MNVGHGDDHASPAACDWCGSYDRGHDHDACRRRNDRGQLGLFGRTPPVPAPPTEAQKRDRALDILRAHRGTLIEAALAVAVRIAKDRGRVTSTEVLAVMRSDPAWAAKVAAADRRFMGPVFRRKMWHRLGWEETGSHSRPVAIWELKR